MVKYTLFVGLFLCAGLVGSTCRRSAKPAEDPSVWGKIHLDFTKLDADGLTGPPDGKVAVHYEFCIPAEEKYWQAVQKIDKSAGKTNSSGRVGCRNGQWLVISSTHQPLYRRVLFELASLPYVERIEETFWE